MKLLRKNYANDRRKRNFYCNLQNRTRGSALLLLAGDDGFD